MEHWPNQSYGNFLLSPFILSCSCLICITQYALNMSMIIILYILHFAWRRTVCLGYQRAVNRISCWIILLRVQGIHKILLFIRYHSNVYFMSLSLNYGIINGSWKGFQIGFDFFEKINLQFLFHICHIMAIFRYLYK